MKNAQDLMMPVSKLTADTIGGLRVTGPAAEGYINLLVYGEPGVGKTRLAGSSVLVPQMAPVLLLDFEGGTLSLADDYSDVEVVRAKSWTEVTNLYNALFDKNPYKTVVLDNITEVQKFVMSQIMHDVVSKDPDRDPDVASLREWGKAGEQLTRLIRGLRDLSCNSIYTAHVNEDKDSSGNVRRLRPGLPGQLKGAVSGYMDIVVYMYQKEVAIGAERTTKTLLLTQGTEKQTAKDRSGKLPPLIEQPTMQLIYDTIHGKGKTT